MLLAMKEKFGWTSSDGFCHFPWDANTSLIAFTLFFSRWANGRADTLGGLSSTKYTSPEWVGGVIFPLWHLCVSAKLLKRPVQIDPLLQSIKPNHRRAHRVCPSSGRTGRLINSNIVHQWEENPSVCRGSTSAYRPSSRGLDDTQTQMEVNFAHRR